MGNTFGAGRLILFGAAAVLLAAATAQGGPAQTGKAYVGSAPCKECHEDEYNKFMAYSKKPHSFKSVLKMKKGLTPQEFSGCLECHSTGYGRPGGFVSETQTPDRASLSCEACHGAGSVHAASGDPKDIVGKPDLDSCRVCHNQERVEAFKFRPYIYSGGH